MDPVLGFDKEFLFVELIIFLKDLMKKKII